jgi:hypothetical protein
LPEWSQELTSVGHPLEVIIRYGSMEKKITGNPEDVAKAVLSFLTSQIPELELASRLVLSADLNRLAEASEGVLAVTPEGVVVTVSTETLADRELLLLHLAKQKIAEMAGKSESDTVQASNLIAQTKRSSGTVAGRLSELSAESLVERRGKGEYRITTLGLHVFQEQVLPKLKKNQGGVDYVRSSN